MWILVAMTGIFSLSYRKSATPEPVQSKISNLKSQIDWLLTGGSKTWKLRELFVGLRIRLDARLLKQGFDIIPAQPELIWQLQIAKYRLDWRWWICGCYLAIAIIKAKFMPCLAGACLPSPINRPNCTPPFWPRISKVVPATWFIRGINPKSQIENPQAPAFIRGVNLKSKI